MAVTINASTTAGLVQTADTSGVLALQTAGTTAITVDASQNVGIGTASPTTKLDNTGSFRSTGATDPTSGTGLELSYRSTYGDVLAYNRTSSAFERQLYLAMLAVNVCVSLPQETFFPCRAVVPQPQVQASLSPQLNLHQTTQTH